MSRVVVIVISSIVLVGLIGLVTFGFVTNWDWDKNQEEEEKKLASSSKAIAAICQPTDYKEACMKSLANVRTDDPKELVRAAFNSAKKELTEVANRSPLLKELEKDPKTADAVKDCRELFEDASSDFERSFNVVGKIEWNQEKVNEMLADLQTWISATRTYQETCLDGFENTTGEASEKVRKVLETSLEMSSNGLAIVNDLSSLFSTIDISSLGLGSFTQQQKIELSHNRRLLSSGSGVTVLGHGRSDDDMLPQWVDGFRRKLLATPDLSSDLKGKANVVVAQDGSGKYKTVEEAFKDIPKNGNDSFIIYIKEGVYKEYLTLQKWHTNVVFVGDGPTKSRITNNQNFADGVKTFKTATLSALGDFFMAKDIGIENSAGAIKHQAVAMRAQSDKSIFFNCHFDGYQDTLYTHTYRQFYRDCKITGTIDFIFGDATAFFQNCTFEVRKPLPNQNCIVTAQGRMERHQPTGIIIHKSKFVADPDYLPVKDKNKAYLGRPWKEYSKTIIMESQIDEFIQPDGWLPWEAQFGLETCYYGEYNNNGGGSSLANRVKWHGVKTIVPSRAESFMPPKLYETDDWIKAATIPYDPNLSTVAAGPTSGVDEDPDAPAGAPSTTVNGSSSASPSSGTPQGSPSPGPSSSTSPAPTKGSPTPATPSPTPSPSPSSTPPSTTSASTPSPTGSSTTPNSGPAPKEGEGGSGPSTSPAPSEEELTGLLTPAPAPEDEADKVAPPTPSSGTKSHSELHVIFSGIVIMWVNLFII